MINKFQITKSKFQISEKQRGFTILESIVAIAILSLSIAGAFTVVQQSLSQATAAKDEVQAFYLAQEAVEVIRNLRDNNQIARVKSGNPASINWLTNIIALNTDCAFNKICKVDGNTMAVSSCGDNWGDCQYLRQDYSTQLFGYNPSWIQTNFKREVKIESVDSDKIAVTVRVTWGKILTRKFEAKVYLLNWI